MIIKGYEKQPSQIYRSGGLLTVSTLATPAPGFISSRLDYVLLLDQDASGRESADDAAHVLITLNQVTRNYDIRKSSYLNKSCGDGGTATQ